MKISAVLLLAVIFASCSSSGYVTVSSRPEPPVYVRPVSPHPGWVWIDGDYYWRGGSYAYRQGYWAAPRPRYSYAPGSWQHRGNGYYWKRGRWHR